MQQNKQDFVIKLTIGGDVSITTPLVSNEARYPALLMAPTLMLYRAPSLRVRPVQV